jgi:hypothetical protein
LQIPEVAFTGDTSGALFERDADLQDMYKAKVLIVELTFVDDSVSVEQVCVGRGGVVDVGERQRVGGAGGGRGPWLLTFVDDSTSGIEQVGKEGGGGVLQAPAGVGMTSGTAAGRQRLGIEQVAWLPQAPAGVGVAGCTCRRAPRVERCQPGCRGVPTWQRPGPGAAQLLVV